MSRFRFPFPRTQSQSQGGFRFPFPQRKTAPQRPGGRRPSFGLPGGNGLKARILIALAIAAFALISYYAKPGDINEVTGLPERVAMTEESQEIQLGLQAAPQMVSQHGGPTRSVAHQQIVDRVGMQLLNTLQRDLEARGRKNPYYDAFQFTLLADRKTINAFALPGGQVFITHALYDQLETEGQLAGVLGHEIGHVLARHGNKRMAKQGLFQALAGAAGVLGGGDQNSAKMAQMISSVLSMKYGRDHELESDKWGVKLCHLAGYDPRAMKGVMKILDRASGGKAPPEFFSTHPKPANRMAYIDQVIAEEFPNGVPPGLRP